MSEHDRLSELGKELPWDRPDAARRDAVRSSLLVAATEGSSRPSARWYLIGGAFAAGAIAAAAAVLLFLRSPEQVPQVMKSSIAAEQAAQFDRVVTRTPTGVDEVVRVRSGKVTIGVGALRAGDHVRVATRDAEVEGEGRYNVVVENEQLKQVNVVEGAATVRVTGQKAVFLAAGQSWQADSIVAHADLAVAVPGTDPVAVPVPVPVPVPDPDPVPGPVPGAVAAPAAVAAPVPRAVAPAAVAAPGAVATPGAAAAPGAVAAPGAAAAPGAVAAPPAPRPRKPPAVVVESTTTTSTPESQPSLPAVTELDKPEPPPPPPAPTSAPKPTTGPKEIERRFQAGMSLLKSNKPADAARELAAAVAASPDDPLAADARYFQAVALTKAGRKTEAEQTLVAFLDRAPKSIRRGRAAVMLARLIAERGDSASARAWFESAVGDADPSVAAAARAGIAALK